MLAVVMQLSVVVIAVWFSVYNGRAIGGVLREPLIFAGHGNNLGVYREDGKGHKWLQMTIKFARQPWTINSVQNDGPSTAPVFNKWERCETGLTTPPDVRGSVTCEDGFVKLANNKCYLFNTQPETWYSAQEVCESKGATLAHPMNPTDNYVIVLYLSNNFQDSPTGWFIGGTDETEEGEWIWADIGCPVVYADWFDDQPDNMDGNEHCIHYGKGDKFQWNDINCNHSFTFICQQ